MIKPSKKITALAIISFSLVGSILISKYLKAHPEIEIFKTKPQVNLEASASQSVANRSSGIENIDTDNDGLKDWEELLWATNTENKDTDGDGATDGDEVLNGRDPKVPGPNDSIKTKESAVNTSSSVNASEKPYTATDAFSQTLFSKYMSIKSTDDGQGVGEEAEDSIVTDLIQNTKTDITYRFYKKDGLEKFGNDQRDALRFYASAFATLHTNFINDLSKNKGNISKDPGIVARLYSKEAENLFSLKVPEDLAVSHINIVNNLSLASGIFSLIEKYENDPLKALNALKTYNDLKYVQSEELRNIAEYLRKNDIIFTDGEVGSFWNNF